MGSHTPYWDADGVESGIFNLLKIIERDPCVPMSFEDITGVLDLFAQSPFINNGPILGLKD